MSTKFYNVFEDRYRGSRELIKSRLKLYLSFLEPFKNIYPDSQIIDLGCGRGEWLELLSEHGFAAQGVDLNRGSLAICQQLGLQAVVAEAVSFLKSLPDQSKIVISGFHLAEHIPFHELKSLVKESLRVLRPAGLLILETPNPENLIVSSTSFYLDPTHQKPIPPSLLSFLPEYYGFKKVKILRLQETSELLKGKISLITVFNGVSPDYAVVAQKDASKELLEMTSMAFEKEYGVTLEQLSSIYDQHNVELTESLNKRIEELEISYAKVIEQQQNQNEYFTKEYNENKDNIDNFVDEFEKIRQKNERLMEKLTEMIKSVEKSQKTLIDMLNNLSVSQEELADKRENSISKIKMLTETILMHTRKGK